MAKLHRYWIRFAPHAPLGLGCLRLGCGVTAWTEDDAIRLLRECVFEDGELPEIADIITDIDFRDLEANHVRPNIGVVSRRGVWFPLGCDHIGAAE